MTGVALGAGEAVEFRVGPAGAYGGDATALAVTVTATPAWSTERDFSLGRQPERAVVLPAESDVPGTLLPGSTASAMGNMDLHGWVNTGAASNAPFVLKNAKTRPQRSRPTGDCRTRPTG